MAYDLWYMACDIYDIWYMMRGTRILYYIILYYFILYSLGAGQRQRLKYVMYEGVWHMIYGIWHAIYTTYGT